MDILALPMGVLGKLATAMLRMMMARYLSIMAILFLKMAMLSFNAVPHGEGEAMDIVRTEKLQLNFPRYIYQIYIYGKEAAEKQKPYIVTDEKDSWMVVGQLPKIQLGGIFKIVISKADGRVIKLTHSK